MCIWRRHNNGLRIPEHFTQVRPETHWKCIKCISHIRCIVHIVYAGNPPPSKLINYTEKTEKGLKHTKRCFDCKYHHKVKFWPNT